MKDLKTATNAYKIGIACLLVGVGLSIYSVMSNMPETTLIGFVLGGLGFVLTVMEKNKGGSDLEELKED